MARLLAFFLLCSIPLNAKPFYKSKAWWATEAASAALIGLDVYSTRRALEAHPGAGDSFPFFGVNTNGKLVGAAFVDLGFSTAFHIAEYHVSPKYGTYFQLPVDAVFHGWAIHHNFAVAGCAQANLKC